MGKKMLFFSVHVACSIPDMMDICDVFLESKIFHINVAWLLCMEAEIPSVLPSIISLGNSTFALFAAEMKFPSACCFCVYLRSDTLQSASQNHRQRHLLFRFLYYPLDT